MHQQVFLFLAMSFCVWCSNIDAQTRELAIVGGTLIDGTGKNPIRDPVILISGSRIQEVGSKGKPSLPPGARILHAEGKTILPGLIDCHIHLLDFMPQLFLHYGVTTVYDTANPTEWILAQRDAIRRGRIPGPRMFVTGWIIDGPPERTSMSAAGERGGYRIHVRSPEEARAAVRALVQQGVDAIKVHEGLTPDLLRAVVEETHRAGLEAVGHSYHAREAALAGLKFIEHTFSVARATIGDPARLKQAEERRAELESVMDPRLFDPLIDLLVKNGVYFNPTISRLWINVMPEQKEWSDLAARILRDPAMNFLPEGRHEAWLRAATVPATMDPSRREEREEALRKVKEFTRRFARAGGKVLPGADAGPSSGPTNLAGLALHLEMQALVDAGVTPMQAVLGATKWSAELLHQEKDLGTVEAGKLADLILIDGDPLADIKTTRNISTVILNGQVVDTTLDPGFVNPLPRPTYADDPLDYRGPQISSINPKIAREGEAAVTLQVIGRRFGRQSVVRFDNRDLPTQFSGDTKLTATLDGASLRRAGTYAVTVVNPGSGGSTSEAVYFVVNFRE